MDTQTAVQLLRDVVRLQILTQKLHPVATDFTRTRLVEPEPVLLLDLFLLLGDQLPLMLDMRRDELDLVRSTETRVLRNLGLDLPYLKIVVGLFVRRGNLGTQLDLS